MKACRRESRFGPLRSLVVFRFSAAERTECGRRPLWGAPHEATAQCGGRSVQRSQGIACRPMRHRSRCLRPSKHRRGRSARKAAPAPKPVGAARSGRSLIDGVQPVSRLPGKQSPAYWQDRSRGTPLQLLRSEVASVWCRRDYSGSGALAPGKELAPLRDRSRMFGHRWNSRAGTSIDCLNRDAVQGDFSRCEN